MPTNTTVEDTTKAYHMVGFEAKEMLQLQSEPELVAAAVAARFRKIIASRALRPAPLPVGIGVGESSSRQFSLDRLAGDDQYIFLSLGGKRYWSEPAAVNYGFVFNAEQLISECSAILRMQDLLTDYEDLLHEVVSQFAPRRNPESYTLAEQAELLDALETGSGSYIPPNDDYYNLLNAVEYQMPGTHPHAKEATELLKARIAKLQKQKQLSAAAALNWLTDLANNKRRASGKVELLVPRKLPLKLALAYVKAGQEVPAGRGGTRVGGWLQTQADQPKAGWP